MSVFCTLDVVRRDPPSVTAVLGYNVYFAILQELSIRKVLPVQLGLEGVNRHDSASVNGVDEADDVSLCGKNGCKLNLVKGYLTCHESSFKTWFPSSRSSRRNLAPLAHSPCWLIAFESN